MTCYVLAMGKQHLGPHVVVGYGIKTFWPGLFITSPDHLASYAFLCQISRNSTKQFLRNFQEKLCNLKHLSTLEN